MLSTSSTESPEPNPASGPDAAHVEMGFLEPGRTPFSPPGSYLSLRQRLLRSLGIGVTVAVFLIVYSVTFFIYRAERQSWQSRQSESVHSAAITVDMFMQQMQDYMTLIGLLNRYYLAGRPDVLEGVLAESPAMLEVIRLDEEGQVFAAAHRDSPVMANLFTIPQSNWFIQAMSGQTYIGELQVSAQNEPYVIVAVPASDGGVVAARLRANVVWEIVADIPFGETGLAYITDHNGQIVAYPDIDVVLARTNIASQMEVQNALAAPDHDWNGLYTNFSGESVMGSTLAVPGTDWTIFTEVSQAEAFAVTMRALLVLGGGMLLGGAVVLFITNLVMQRAIFEPVETLRDGAERIGLGNLSHRIQIAQRDEIGQVAEAFNEMAVRLRDREAALALARDEALQASRFKSRLLANVSHDLRTPLTAIIGYTDMLAVGVYGDLSETQQSTVARIVVNAKRLLTLIGSLLDQAQIEAGKLNLHYAPFAPAELMEEIHTTLNLVAEAKDIALITQIDPDLPDQLTGDAQRLYQIVFNLVGNAIKFTPEGEVRVRFYPVDASYWAIDVSDTGQGIPEDAQAYIFEAFRQVEGRGDEERGGVGLGLSIVKQLTLLMGGEVYLASHLGQGSTFTVLLPLETPESGLELVPFC
ncbi:MAG: sensor histidine kinase [Anaerolineae bacterium]|nr:sensor histidine kinase [Anaerolineae bacterium]